MIPRFVVMIICLGAAADSQVLPRPDHLKLEDGTPIKLRLQRTISSADAHVDDRIDFDVLEEVNVNDVVVVPKGSLAWGTVTAAQSKRRMGRGGKLDINIDAVRLADGNKAALRAVKTLSGGGHTGAMTGAIVATSMIPIAWPAAPLFLLMHGKDITIPKGTEITAYINGDFEVDRLKFDKSRPGTAIATTLAAYPQSEAKASADASTMVIKSEPEGADISIDGKFVGNTPSTLQLNPGDHSVSIQKSGYAAWQRSIAITSGGIVTLNASLLRNQ